MSLAFAAHGATVVLLGKTVPKLEAVYDAIFEQAGVIRVDTIDELFDFANAFAFKSESAVGKISRRIPNGNRVAIVTNAGGPGILAADALGRD